jgi:hypothetical protein
MRRVCVLGNSHSACLKLAWDSLQVRYPQIALTFFAQRGAGIADLEPRGGALVPTSAGLKKAITHTSGGHSRIDLQDFDVVLMVGVTCGYPLVMSHFSYAAARQTLLDLTPKTVAFDLIGKIRQISDIPIFVAHQPLRTHLGDWDGANDLGPYRRLVDDLNDALMQDVGAILLRQPAQTIANQFFTRPEFAIGSMRLDIGGKSARANQTANPNSHMNARYGDIYLSTHLPAVAYATAGQSVTLSSSGT